MPPSLSPEAIRQSAEGNEVKLLKIAGLVREENDLTMHAYKEEHEKNKRAAIEYTRLYNAAMIIQKYWRREPARKELIHLRTMRMYRRRIQRFFKMTVPRKRQRNFEKKVQKLMRVQALYRGVRARYAFYCEGGLYHELFEHQQRNIAATKIKKAFREYKQNNLYKIAQVASRVPKSFTDWERIVGLARRPIRTIGVSEEWLYPGSKNVFFYRHKITGKCQFKKPLELEYQDIREAAEKEQLEKYGYTFKQVGLATKLQAMWRGYRVRSYYILVERALNICDNTEKIYLNDPTNEIALYNYMVYVFVVKDDIDHARQLMTKALQIMSIKGPDVSYVLYTYAIFTFVTQDLDLIDTMMYIARAREAERRDYELWRKKFVADHKGDEPSSMKDRMQLRVGRSYDLANIGFYRRVAQEVKSQNAWHNYAACCYLVFDDYKSSFEAFLQAFGCDPSNKKLKQNFDVMMTHFHGDDQAKQVAIVRERMEVEAQKDLDAYNRYAARVDNDFKTRVVTKLQAWYRMKRLRFAYLEGNDDTLLAAAKS
jgi:hypothetical protein